MKCELSHEDTCCSDMLTDHHHRSGECLVGVPATRETTIAELAEMVREELGHYLQVASDAPTDEDVDLAVDSLFGSLGDRSRPWDPSLPGPEDGDDEPLQVWFLLEWSEEESDVEPGEYDRPLDEEC